MENSLSIDSIAGLAQYGLSGVCVALIILVGVCIYFQNKAYSQHAEIFGTKMKESNESNIEVAEALVILKEVIQELRNDLKK